MEEINPQEPGLTRSLYIPHCTTKIVINNSPKVCGWEWDGKPLDWDEADWQLQEHFIHEHGGLSMLECSGYNHPVLQPTNKPAK